MNFLFMICVALRIAGIATNDILSKLDSYFRSDIVRSFEELWKAHQVSFENTLNMALEQGYGHKVMNVYINRFQDPLTLSIGYYHTDNQVHMVIEDMNLEELPHLISADIHFPLSSNVLSFDATVSKIIVHGTYVLFRNASSLIFSLADQDPYTSSPFRFQQVRNIGDMAIIIDGCSLSGVVIASLTGNSVHLGYNQMRLTDCQYNLEINSPGSGAPPVMVPYLPKGDKHLNIEHLLIRPITEELMPKLQAAMFSYINTSAVLSEKFQSIVSRQKNIFEVTKNYINKLVGSMNEKSIQSNMGSIKLGDFTIVWDDPFEAIPNSKTISLSEMLLMGLDTLYSANTGGPFRMAETEIAEQLRFSAMQVVGKMSIEGFKEKSEFAVEIFDFAVDVTLDSKLQATFEPVGWRFLEFSCPKLEFPPVESLIVGYLLNELPIRITSHLNSIFKGVGSQSLDLSAEDAVEEITGDGQFLSNVAEPVKEDDNIEVNVEIGSSKETLTDSNNVLQLHGETALNLQSKVKPGDPHTVETYQEGDNSNKVHENGNNVNINGEETMAQEQEGHILKLVGESIKSEPQAKLKIDTEPHFVEKGPIKLHHVNVEPYKDDDDRDKPHNLKLTNNKPTDLDQEAKIVQLLGESIQSKPVVQLHNVEAEAHFVDKGPIKVHHVEVDTYQGGADSDSEANGNIKQLHYQESRPYKEETQLLQLLDDGIKSKSKVQLHNVEAQPEFVDKGPVKLHHVAVDPHQEDISSYDGSVRNKKQSNYQDSTLNTHTGIKKKPIVKLHSIGQEPHFVKKGAIKLLHAAEEPYVENLRSSHPNKGLIRNKSPGKRNKLQKTVIRKNVRAQKQVKSVKSASRKLNQTIAKTDKK